MLHKIWIILVVKMKLFEIDFVWILLHSEFYYFYLSLKFFLMFFSRNPNLL